MLRLGLILFLLLFPFAVSADETEEQLKSFLQSRVVVDQVYFTTASNNLSLEAQQKLDSLVTKLGELSTKGYLLRVEGFASPEGSATRNVNLSMHRAMSVRNYLRDKHSLNLDLFLTGFGEYEGTANPEVARRVDIAVYQQPKAAIALFDDRGTVEKIEVK